MEGFYKRSRKTEESLHILLKTMYPKTNKTLLQPQDKVLYDYLCGKACFAEQPYNDCGKNITVGIGEYVISDDRLLEEMSSLKYFKTRGGLRRSIERLKKFGLITTDTNGHPTKRFKVVHYNSDYECEPSITMVKEQVRARGVSQGNSLTNKASVESVSQGYRHIKEECSIKEVCNTSSSIDTDNMTDDSGPTGTGSVVISPTIDDDNDGPGGPYGVADDSDIPVSSDSWIDEASVLDDDGFNYSHSQDSGIPVAENKNADVNSLPIDRSDPLGGSSCKVPVNEPQPPACPCGASNCSKNIEPANLLNFKNILEEFYQGWPKEDRERACEKKKKQVADASTIDNEINLNAFYRKNPPRKGLAEPTIYPVCRFIFPEIANDTDDL